MEKPILFSTEMVKAILEGRKTQTRRKIKFDLSNLETDKNDKTFAKLEDEYGDSHDLIEYAPYHAGDTLWVRETFCYDDFDNGGETVYYKANFGERHIKELFTDCGMKWTPSIHMPRAAARLFLKVTDVRCERLQNITGDGVLKEGVKLACHREFDNCSAYPCDFMHTGSCKDKFVTLWNSTVKKQDLDRYGWDSNPWVWVIEFERMA